MLRKSNERRQTKRHSRNRKICRIQRRPNFRERGNIFTKKYILEVEILQEYKPELLIKIEQETNSLRMKKKFVSSAVNQFITEHIINKNEVNLYIYKNICKKLNYCKYKNITNSAYDRISSLLLEIDLTTKLIQYLIKYYLNKLCRCSKSRNRYVPPIPEIDLI